jgi:hypothetical protein
MSIKKLEANFTQHYGTENFYKNQKHLPFLLYTDGVKDLWETHNIYWTLLVANSLLAEFLLTEITSIVYTKIDLPHSSGKKVKVELFERDTLVYAFLFEYSLPKDYDTLTYFVGQSHEEDTVFTIYLPSEH